MGPTVCAKWVMMATLVFQAVLMSEHKVMGATTAITGEQIEGSDPCPTGDDSAYGSGYQVVASKPSSQSDVTSSGDAGLGCEVPLQACGDVTEVEAQCRQTAGCVAFSYDGRCGYLKTSAQPLVQRSGWTTYVLA